MNKIINFINKWYLVILLCLSAGLFYGLFTLLKDKLESDNQIFDQKMGRAGCHIVQPTPSFVKDGSFLVLCEELKNDKD